jgi:excisionase family DNA binding protein
VNTNSIQPVWITITEAAQYLSVSVGFLRKCVRLRKVPFVRAGSKSLRFRKSDLDRWLQANGCDGEENGGWKVS